MKHSCSSCGFVAVLRINRENITEAAVGLTTSENTEIDKDISLKKKWPNYHKLEQGVKGIQIVE